jgi:hypothetical protein
LAKRFIIPRVWKYFLRLLFWPVCILMYIIGLLVLGTKIGSIVPDEDAQNIIMCSLIVMPVAVFVLRELWLRASQQAQEEEEEMMRRLRRDPNAREDLYES